MNSIQKSGVPLDHSMSTYSNDSDTKNIGRSEPDVHQQEILRMKATLETKYGKKIIPWAFTSEMEKRALSEGISKEMKNEIISRAVVQQFVCKLISSGLFNFSTSSSC